MTARTGAPPTPKGAALAAGALHPSSQPARASLCGLHERARAGCRAETGLSPTMLHPPHAPALAPAALGEQPLADAIAIPGRVGRRSSRGSRRVCHPPEPDIVQGHALG